VEGESNNRSTAVGNTTTIATESDDETIIKNRTQYNAVIPSQKEMYRVVGVETTTSATVSSFLLDLVNDLI
jgi:hypothetical protein